MKTLKNIILILMLGLGLMACEKNDPIADQGTLTGNITAFNLLAQMPDAKVVDTLMLRTVCWAVNDDINNVSFYYRGFKIKSYSVKMGLIVNSLPVQLSADTKTDTLFIDRTLIRSYPEAGESLNEYYQTIENAYVIVCPFIVGEGFSLVELSGAALIEEMSDVVFAAIVKKLSLQMNRGMVQKLFPSAPVACYEFDQQGFFTGNLTEFGFQYVQNNMTREMLIENLSEATVEDNTRGTIESVAKIAVTNALSTSARNFRIIK
jgi:hypothetical protein